MCRQLGKFVALLLHRAKLRNAVAQGSAQACLLALAKCAAQVAQAIAQKMRRFYVALR
jgi:hypothetical protein